MTVEVFDPLVFWVLVCLLSAGIISNVVAIITIRKESEAAIENKLLKDDIARINRVRDKMKEEAGYSRNTSFDVVWKEVLEASRKGGDA